MTSHLSSKVRGKTRKQEQRDLRDFVALADVCSRLYEIREQLELEAYAEQQRDFHSYERPQRRPECVIESALLCDPGALERERAYLRDLGDEIFERLRRLR